MRLDAKWATCFLALLFFAAIIVQAQHEVTQLSKQAKDIVMDSSFDHDKWKTEPVDYMFEFAAYTTSFDSDEKQAAEECKHRIPELAMNFSDLSSKDK